MVEDTMLTAIRDGLAARADRVKAREMQRYMKSEMPFSGVQKPARVALAREVFTDLDDDLWKRRAAIIAQVRRKAATDFALLVDLIEPNRGDREFFIRKDELSPLSRREALKHTGGK